ncbi:FMN-binding protein [Clostridium sp. BJN0013]|mgnify:CR=1 FL=1|uniref:FMN-binding protein n=1 Tax=Clostridium sp. BJN0013 TaxID=3236840 RepID=UPI0034C5E430
MKTVKKRKGKIRVWIVILSIVGVIALGLGAAVVLTAPGRNELQNMAITDVDFKKLRDGVYTGAYHGTKDSFRNAAVEVTVASGAVTKIKVTEGALADEKQTSEVRNGLSINDLFNRVIKSQSLKVDVISGATLTSNAHLKAVENALEQAEVK